jgi:hypothetical protein
MPPRQIFSCPLSVSVRFQHLSDRVKSARTLPQWVTLLGGRLYKKSAVAITLGTLSITRYKPRERLVELGDRVATPQNMLGTEIIYPKILRTAFFGRRSILWTSAAISCHSSGCDPPHVRLAPSLTPRETRISHGWTTASECLALALIPGCH